MYNGLYVRSTKHVCFITVHFIYVCTYITGALSVTDSDDDYCVSYTVTMVDIRSCTRPPRLHDQQHISEYPHMSIPPRSPDQTDISKCTDISIQPKSLYPQSSTNVGKLCVLCMIHRRI